MEDESYFPEVWKIRQRDRPILFSVWEKQGTNTTVGEAVRDSQFQCTPVRGSHRLHCGKGAKRRKLASSSQTLLSSSYEDQNKRNRSRNWMISGPVRQFSRVTTQFANEITAQAICQNESVSLKSNLFRVPKHFKTLSMFCLLA